MGVKIPISEARRRLSGLLKSFQEHPEKVYEITVNDTVFGELSAPRSRKWRIGTGEALLRALQEIGKPTVQGTKRRSVARNHDDYLYRRKRK